MTSFNLGQTSMTRLFPVTSFKVLNKSCIQDGTPLIAVIGIRAAVSASGRTFAVQSAMLDSSRGGKVYGRLHRVTSMAEIALKSPDRLPFDSRLRSVFPPMKKIRPLKTDAFGA